MKTTHLLIWTNGYEINTTQFEDYETAFNEMKRQYDNETPNENNGDCKDMSSISTYDAILYCNHEDVLVWTIVKIK